MRRHFWIKLSLFGASLLLLAILCLLPREPSYQGRPLSAWLRVLENGEMEERWQAAEAVRAIGTNALPFLISQLPHRDRAPETRLKRTLRTLLSKQSLIKNLPPTPLPRREALAALDALGPTAKAAIPAVASLLHDDPPDPEAVLVLARLGPESVPLLNQALTNNEKVVRYAARLCLDLRRSDSPFLFPKTPEEAEYNRRACEFNFRVSNMVSRENRHPGSVASDRPRPSGETGNQATNHLQGF